MADELPIRIVAGIDFVGRSGGPVKTLSGYRKGQHSLPTAATPATQLFLGKICASELAQQAERLFQEVRTGLGYKRKEITLSVATPNAILAARDFGLEIGYALDGGDASRYVVTTTLRELRDAEIARGAAFTRIFAGAFSEISLALRNAASVEDVIDAIEGLGPDSGLTVQYPSDYRDCSISVAGIDAEVRCTGATLDIVFPRGGSPWELIEAFAEIRHAFQVSKTLRGLIG